MGKSKSEPNPSKQSPPWIELPSDVTANILHRLGAIEILESAQKVCTTWRSVCKEPSMWRIIDMTNLEDIPYNFDLMFRLAVDRSQGQLIELNIEYFNNEELLLYFAQRSSELKCLKLVCCDEISGTVLREAVAKFPNLEEFHLILMPYIQQGDIESIGHSCPKLKSFTLNGNWRRSLPRENNDYALAVAESMHGLHHLKFFANQMSNDGLQAILDGCPYLESLDIRGCFNVVLEGHLGKRCSQQIKDLRHPSESIVDYEWESKIDDDEPIDDDDFSAYSENYSVDDDDYVDPYCTEEFSDD